MRMWVRMRVWVRMRNEGEAGCRRSQAGAGHPVLPPRCRAGGGRAVGTPVVGPDPRVQALAPKGGVPAPPQRGRAMREAGPVLLRKEKPGLSGERALGRCLRWVAGGGKAAGPRGPEGVGGVSDLPKRRKKEKKKNPKDQVLPDWGAAALPWGQGLGGVQPRRGSHLAVVPPCLTAAQGGPSRVARAKATPAGSHQGRSAGVMPSGARPFCCRAAVGVPARGHARPWGWHHRASTLPPFPVFSAFCGCFGFSAPTATLYLHAGGCGANTNTNCPTHGQPLLGRCQAPPSPIPCRTGHGDGVTPPHGDGGGSQRGCWLCGFSFFFFFPFFCGSFHLPTPPHRRAGRWRWGPPVSVPSSARTCARLWKRKARTDAAGRAVPRRCSQLGPGAGPARPRVTGKARVSTGSLPRERR